MSEIAMFVGREVVRTQRVWGRVVGFLVGIAVLLSACGGGGGGITIDARKGGFEFVPKVVTVSANTPTSITFNNPDAIIHDWTIDSIEVGGKTEKIQLLADPGKKETKTYTFTRPGTYEVYCSQPGHKEAGMVGTLVVQ